MSSPSRAPGAAGRRSSAAPTLALVLLALIWGYGWVVLKVGLQDASPFTFAVLRNVAAAAALFLVLLLTGRPVRPPRPFELVLLLGVFQTAGFIGLSSWALVSGGAGKTAVLVYTMPFWLLLFAWLVLRERLAGLQWVAVCLAAVGLVLVLVRRPSTRTTWWGVSSFGRGPVPEHRCELGRWVGDPPRPAGVPRRTFGRNTASWRTSRRRGCPARRRGCPAKRPSGTWIWRSHHPTVGSPGAGSW